MPGDDRIVMGNVAPLKRKIERLEYKVLELEGDLKDALNQLYAARDAYKGWEPNEKVDW